MGQPKAFYRATNVYEQVIYQSTYLNMNIFKIIHETIVSITIFQIRRNFWIYAINHITS